MRLITLLLPVLFATAVNAQDKITLGPKEPDYYKHKRRIAVMHEDFNDDSKSWIGPNVPADANVTIADGIFQLNNTPYTWFLDIPIQDVRDFEIELVAKVEAKKLYEHYGWFSWGDSTCNLHGLHFRFDNWGKILLFGCQYGDCEKKKIRHYVQPRKRDFNKFSIRKIDHQYYVFLNDNYAFSHPFMPLRGNKFVVGTSDDTKVLFDYIKISYLN